MHQYKCFIENNKDVRLDCNSSLLRSSEAELVGKNSGRNFVVIGYLWDFLVKIQHKKITVLHFMNF